jgi:hypothetical protein
MDFVLEAALLVIWVDGLKIYDLGVVEQLMVKA